MDESNINQRNHDTTVNDATVVLSDNDELDKDCTKSIEQNNSNILDKLHKVPKDSDNSINIHENDENIYHADSCVEDTRTNCMYWKGFSKSGVFSTSTSNKNHNPSPHNPKEEICYAGEPSCEVGSKNRYGDVQSSNRSILYCLCLKLSKFLFRSNKRPNNSDLEEQVFDNDHYLDRFYLEKSKRSTHHRFFANFKERVKHVTRPSSVKIKDNYFNNPLRRTYQVYFGEMTDGGIEYDPESFNWIVPVVLTTVLILLVMTVAYNVFWNESEKLDEWASSTYGPAILCALGCFAIFVIDITFSFFALIRHPVASWICLIIVWASVQCITFYIGVTCRSKHTDNMLIVIVTPAVITSGVVLEFLWLSLIKMDLTRSIVPHVLSTIGALSLLAVMTGMTWGTLLYEIHELVICWIVALYYSISMIVLLQMILTQKIYEFKEYDVALPAMLLFVSPYSLITNLIRYYVFLARSEPK